MYADTLLSSSMLTMVIANPIQLTMVSAEPTSVGGAFLATKVENWGESPDTTVPQKIKIPKKNPADAWKNKGEKRQQIPDAAS